MKRIGFIAVIMAAVLCCLTTSIVMAESLDFRKYVGLPGPKAVAKKDNFVVTASYDAVSTFSITEGRLDPKDFINNIDGYIIDVAIVDSWLFVVTSDVIVRYEILDDDRIVEDSRITTPYIDVSITVGNVLYSFHNSNGSAFSLDLKTFDSIETINGLPEQSNTYYGYSVLRSQSGFVLYNNEFIHAMDVLTDGQISRAQISLPELGLSGEDGIEKVLRYQDKLAVVTAAQELLSIDSSFAVSSIVKHTNKGVVTIPYSNRRIFNAFNQLVINDDYSTSSLFSVTLFGNSFTTDSFNFNLCGGVGEIKRLNFFAETDNTFFVYGESCGLYLYNADLEQIAVFNAPEVLRYTIIDNGLYTLPSEGNLYKNAIASDSSEL